MCSSVNFFPIQLKKPVSLDLHAVKANRVRNIDLTPAPKLEIKKKKKNKNKKEEKIKKRNFTSCNTEMKSMQKRTIFEGYTKEFAKCPQSQKLEQP